MATTTPNFGWSVPTSTDLVKDGATAIETLGDAIDASLVDLKGGTTGQILSKNSNSDMDFTWAAPASGDITAVTAGTGISGGGTSGDVTITNSMATAIDAKGDLIAGTAADTFSRLAIGSNNQVLTADSAAATGMKWATPSAGFSGTYDSFTPSVWQSTTPNVAVDVKYTNVGNFYHMQGLISVTSGTGTANNPILLSLPGAGPASGQGEVNCGIVRYYDSSAGSYSFGQAVAYTSSPGPGYVSFQSGINKTTYRWGTTGSELAIQVGSGDEIFVDLVWRT